MGAALIGLPLAGLAGAFFAVPIVAFFHIVIREFAYAHHMAAPTATGPSASEQTSPNQRAGPAASSPET
jgi:predicted PurR-regulated permease PerM